ncbi:16S rRNA (guanine(527)-N(7))-methyltransferase RsmG [Marivibrio halodurans]|uniref:Ribosomal RNA small subunit methyltransferase G n=1 Tax=Marivibrio halodurans TaxID=2039722 RepID=A0A8J7S0L8_9PROT|nr:16S rRNA (guanine(527)-N(7))-methyltransferase RsmG [Marivibrio halodurans]MBP5858152.1 16S rRNA (guanine(527)-N(7))-methyltransferase RsmG [Marivibrio halodurans]
MDGRGFAECTGVSRETLDRLTAYAALLTKWQRRINLVGPKTVPDLWRRHMLDSAQLLPRLPPGTKTVVDLGSGAGFPGLVLAALGTDRGDGGIEQVHLVESDQRKAVFLREAARAMALGSRVTVHAARIESLDPIRADCVTARALAPVGTLLDYAARLVGENVPCVFLKGKRLEDELTDAKSSWYIKYRIDASQTDAEGAILTIEDFADVRRDSRIDDPPQG